MDDVSPPASPRKSRVVARAGILVLAGPLVLLGGAVALWAAVQQFLSGWLPSEWILVPVDEAGVVDSFFGVTKGSGRRYLNLLAGALVATVGATGISRVWKR